MRSKSRETSSEITLSNGQLDGYSGRFEVIQLRRNPWWRRALRLKRRTSRRMIYANVKGTTARAWPYRAAKRRFPWGGSR